MRTNTSGDAAIGVVRSVHEVKSSMPRTVRKTADGEIAELLERPQPCARSLAGPVRLSGVPLLPDNVVEFLNGAPDDRQHRLLDQRVPGCYLRKLLGRCRRWAVKINEIAI